MATEEKILKDAQFRKGAGIAFFNSTNAAISLVAAIPEIAEMTNEHIVDRVRFFRDTFLEDHKAYYAYVIANAGAVYKVADSVAKLGKATTKAELRDIWLGLSEDERHDGEIRKVASELKSKLQ